MPTQPPPLPTPRRRFSKAAEDFVAARLEKAGWLVVARNVRHVGFELDLVATKGRTLIVVEVKARQRAPSSDREFQMLLPPKKKAALRRGSDRALAIYGQGVTSARIDLAVVYRHPEQSEGTLVLRYFVDLPLS